MKDLNEVFFNNVEAAFFDLDDTITDTDTDRLWYRWRVFHSITGIFELFRLIKILIKYGRGTLDPWAYSNFQKDRIARLTYPVYEKLAEKLFQKKGIKHIIPQMAQLIAMYLERNIPVIIITTQEYEIARHFAHYLKCTDIIANRFTATDKGLAVVEPVCFREGKVLRAEEYAGSHSISLEKSVFYSDSINDVPLLSRVAHPVAVNPDKRLADHAVKWKWPIVDFKGNQNSVKD